MEFFPKSRYNKLIIQNLNEETLIYDLQTNKALCLNETASLVWQFCDGRHSVEDLAAALGRKLKNKVSNDFIWLALKQLEEQNLLQNGSPVKAHSKHISRRESIKKIGAASMIALPIISTLVAPRAADAQSVACGGSCTCSVGNTDSFVPKLCRSVLGGTSGCPNRPSCDCLVVAGVGSTGGTCNGT